MKIDNVSQGMNQINNMDIAPKKQTNDEDRSVRDDSGKINRPDAKVDISSTSVEYNRAAEEMEKVPDERAEKIEHLKNQVQNETYHVDAEKIAKKIVEDSISTIIEP